MDTNNKDMKQCIKCGVYKPIEQFQFRTDTKQYRNQCKRCRQDHVNTYRRENEEYKKRYNQYRQHKRTNDTQFAVTDRLRARIRKMLKAQDGKKYVQTTELLGCSYEEFKTYIVSQFYGDMSWTKQNFVLDHKVPCCWFNLQNLAHQKICFNYKKHTTSYT